MVPANERLAEVREERRVWGNERSLRRPICSLGVGATCQREDLVDDDEVRLRRSGRAEVGKDSMQSLEHA